MKRKAVKRDGAEVMDQGVNAGGYKFRRSSSSSRESRKAHNLTNQRKHGMFRLRTESHRQVFCDGSFGWSGSKRQSWLLECGFHSNTPPQKPTLPLGTRPAKGSITEHLSVALSAEASTGPITFGS